MPDQQCTHTKTQFIWRYSNLVTIITIWFLIFQYHLWTTYGKKFLEAVHRLINRKVLGEGHRRDGWSVKLHKYGFLNGVRRTCRCIYWINLISKSVFITKIGGVWGGGQCLRSSVVYVYNLDCSYFQCSNPQIPFFQIPFPSSRDVGRFVRIETGLGCGFVGIPRRWQQMSAHDRWYS